MDFQLTEIQALIAQTTASVVAEHVDDRRSRPEEAQIRLWSRLAEFGLLGAEIEATSGGSGGGFEDVALILQGLGRGAAAGPFIPSIVMGAGLVSRLGDSAQKQTLLPAIVEGKMQVVLAHQCPDFVREDAITTSAEVVEGGWILRGQKVMVLGGGAAGTFIVPARTVQGLSLFLLPAETSGARVEPLRLYDGDLAAVLTLNACFVPKGSLLGREGAGDAAMAWTLDRANAAIANEAVGLMAELCDLTLNHIKTREQFGQALGKFQVVQHGMVNMRIELELARSMAILAAVAADCPDEVRRARDVSAAKVAVSRAARFVGKSAIQLHGAIALTNDYPAGAYFRRLTLIERVFGDSTWHLKRYAKLAA